MSNITHVVGGMVTREATLILRLGVSIIQGHRFVLLCMADDVVDTWIRAMFPPGPSVSKLLAHNIHD